MRICKVSIENYRNIKKVDVELGSIVTLIGENNSGKSNFLRAIALPLTFDDSNFGKRLTWYDINKEAKDQYYKYIIDNRESIVNGTMDVKEFVCHVPIVQIILYFQPEKSEHYDVKDILVDKENWIGGIKYRFYLKKPEELLKRVSSVLNCHNNDTSIQMSLLPMELFDYSLTVPGKENKVPFDTISRFRSVVLPAERDSFASNADRLGSKALSDLLQKKLSPESQVEIEKAYYNFFETVRKEGKLDTILNWQDYSDIQNAQDFFKQINILPNMPQMSTILGSIRLGYEEDNMFMQGLGHRNLILMTVLLNSYLNKEHDISFRLMTIEEPEAHLCVNNTLLMASLFNHFANKNKFSQIVYSTHNVELVNKIGLDKVIILHHGEAIAVGSELSDAERDYLAANPNTDIFKLLYSRRAILVEGITEELLIKSYFQTRTDLNDIKILSFHKGFTKIIDIWKKVNVGSGNKLGIVRDYDDEPNAKKIHAKKQSNNIIVCTTHGYTLETDITNANYDLLKTKYGNEYGWSNMSAKELQDDWRKKKSDVMLKICHDLVNGDLEGFSLPPHIKSVVDFMLGENNEG